MKNNYNKLVNRNKVLDGHSILKIKPIVLFAFCLFIYMPSFNIPQLFSQILSIGVPILYILCNLKMIKKINFVHWKLLILMMVLIMLSCIVPILHDTMDLSYFSTLTFFLKRAMTYLALVCLIVKKHGEERALEYFMYYFVLMNVVYVIGTIIIVLIPGLRNLWFSTVNKDLITTETLNAINASKYTFRIGWQGFSGFHQTFYCTLSAIFALYLRYRAKSIAVGKKQFFIIFVFCILGNMFYGRIGLVATTIASVACIIYWNREKIKQILIFGLLTILLTGMGIFILKNIPELNSWYEWFSSPIANLITTGDMQDKSFNKLQTMWQVDVSEETLLLGDGYYNVNSHYYMNTDVGFIRNILFWGIIGAIVSYGAILYAVWDFKKIDNWLALLLLTIIIIFEYKGVTYYTFLPIAFALGTALRIGRNGEKRCEKTNYNYSKSQVDFVRGMEN